MHESLVGSGYELSDTAIAAQAVPPGLAIAIKDCTLRSGDLEVRTSDLDEWVVRIKVFPEGRAFEGDLGSGL